MPHSRTTNVNPHMPNPEPRDGQHPPRHLLLPHAKTTRRGTHSRIPPCDTYHLQSDRDIHHSNPRIHDPGSPPHHRPHHMPVPAHERMPTPTSITSRPHVLHRRLRRVPLCTHHKGSHRYSWSTPRDNTAWTITRGITPTGPPHTGNSGLSQTSSPYWQLRYPQPSHLLSESFLWWTPLWTHTYSSA